MEEWRNYNSFLKISNTGRVIRVYKKKEIELNGFKIGGYVRINAKNRGITVNKFVHQLVWITFVGEIPKGFQIDHINTIRDDNRLCNLRIVTPKQNANNPLTKEHQLKAVKGRKNPKAVEAMIKANSKKVRCFSKDGLFVKEYGSIKEASDDTLICFQNISKCCKKKRKTAGGYIWEFFD